ncbi:hypothetical protein N0V88_000593 [Collariella sp. IMI 366227]|nr:hypothetical protein N0V88_000593 [Collariella sp. IMI 366227]
MLISTVNQSLFGLVISVVIYPIFLRGTIWRTMLMFLRPIYNLPRSNMTPSTLPFSFTSILRCWGVSLMMLVAWNAANTAFSLFLVKNPLKNRKPLTSDSKDPNGSLLNGLKNKKLSIKCFAMWELAFIARDFPDRRKAIYEDIDRKDGPMWSQVYKLCLDTPAAKKRSRPHQKPHPQVLHTALGWPFRRHYRRRLARAVLGEPYGEPSLYVNAAWAVGGLAVHSLREDKYGNVQRDVAGLVRSLTGLVGKLEGFRGLKTDWTDVEGRGSVLRWKRWWTR